MNKAQEMQIDNDKTIRATFEWTVWLGLGPRWARTMPGLMILMIRAMLDIIALLVANLKSITERTFNGCASYHAVKTNGTENRSQTLQNKKSSSTGSWLCWQPCNDISVGTR